MTPIGNIATLHSILLLVWIGATATPWTKDLQVLEKLDEEHDVEILKAVFNSMEGYWLRRLMTHHRRKRSESVVCYGDIGCFEDTGPFGYLDMLPSSPEEVSTRFLLYSPHARSDAPLLDVPFANMSGIWPWALHSFNASASTKIIVHGFGSSCSHVWVYEMRTALVTVEECNVICVDWESGAIIPNYVRAAANTRLVGKQLAMLIKGLQEHVGLQLGKVHLIGFSLGAHVAGFAGAELKNISRITGLDPAGPLFESQDPRARLDSTDAVFVDVIHSNGENLILGGLGSWQPMGHVDFYPNGGRMQKGCTNLFVGAVSDIIWSASDIEGRSLCNHRRAYKFFTDSVSPRCHFPSFSCDSYEAFLEGNCFLCTSRQNCGNMGYYADKSSARGTLYLVTREEEPFCAHQYHVTVESSQSKLPVVSYGKIQMTLLSENNLNETFTLTKKDDEELGVGTTLSKIVVPHPALLELTGTEIIYTAYSGWISSGLKKWSIDRIKISDSFGNSMSVCKKDLILESGVPISLKLYPGECNLPKENVELTTIDPFFLSDIEVKNQTTTTTVSPETTTVLANKTVDGYPAYIITGLGNAKNKTVEVPVPISKLSVQKKLINNSDVFIRKNEILEPVLQPKIKDLKTEESKISIVKPRGINVSANEINSTLKDTWIPSVELFPPPVGGKQLWESSREPKQFQTMGPPSVRKNTDSKVSTLQNKLLNKTRTGTTRQRMYNYAPKPGKNEGVVTVQLFPQHLASLLKQAEQYAKMSLFSPLDIFYRNRNNVSRNEKRTRVNEKRNLHNETKIEEKKDNYIGTPRLLDSGRPKNLIPRIYEYFEKGLENVRNLLGWDASDNQRLDTLENVDNSSLVPYYYVDKDKEMRTEKYIPLSSDG